MIFGWLKRRAAMKALRDVCGFVDVERFDGGVRSIPLSVRDARTVAWHSDDDRWRVSVRGVNAPARLLHPASSPLASDAARSVLEELMRQQAPHEVETVDGALVVTLAQLPDNWHLCETAIFALADAVRAAGGTIAACPSCGAALLDRGGLASCDACKGRLITGDVARERIFDPRAINPGALKDASVGRGLVTRCPSCAHSMAPVLVDDTVIDVCRGCGAVWCDAGEHARLMGGMA